MDIYESAMTALKIPFIPLGIRSPSGYVLKAVMVNWMVRLNAPLLQSSISFLFTQPLYQ